MTGQATGSISTRRNGIFIFSFLHSKKKCGAEYLNTMLPLPTCFKRVSEKKAGCSVKLKKNKNNNQLTYSSVPKMICVSGKLDLFSISFYLSVIIWCYFLSHKEIVKCDKISRNIISPWRILQVWNVSFIIFFGITLTRCLI